MVPKLVHELAGTAPPTMLLCANNVGIVADALEALHPLSSIQLDRPAVACGLTDSRGTDAGLAGRGLLRPRPLPSCRCSTSREGCARRDGGATDGRGFGRLRRQRLAGVGNDRRRELRV